MKRIALAFTISTFASPLWAAIQTVSLSVPGMYCASCPFIVQGAIQELPGIESVVPDLESRTAVVVYDDALTSIEAITTATANVGYESEVIEAGS